MQKLNLATMIITILLLTTAVNAQPVIFSDIIDSFMEYFSITGYAIKFDSPETAVNLGDSSVIIASPTINGGRGTNSVLLVQSIGFSEDTTLTVYLQNGGLALFRQVLQ